MSREPLSAAKFESSATTTVEMTEIDGMEQDAILQFTDVGKFGKPSKDKQARTCYGDLYVIVNALRDYANLLESVVDEWNLTGFHDDDRSVVLVCNDEGKVMNLPANRGLRDKNGQICDIICGTFFICSAPGDSDHFTSLAPEQIKRYEKRFYTPEMFWGMNGRIVCLPMEVD